MERRPPDTAARGALDRTLPKEFAIDVAERSVLLTEKSVILERASTALLHRGVRVKSPSALHESWRVGAAAWRPRKELWRRCYRPSIRLFWHAT
jgi:hypothetical protein